MSRVGWLAAWATGMAAALLAAPCHAQNIDAGKSAAQIFADTCAACHRSARELKRTNVGFLRQHYMAGPQEATAMANYLSGVPSDPRTAQPKRPPAAVGGPADTAKQQPKQQPGADEAKSAQAQQRGGRPGATAEVVGQSPVEPSPVRPSLAPAAEEKPPLRPRPAPALEPFEE